MTNNETIFIRFTFDDQCAWVEARDDEPAYKTCAATSEQVAQVRANANLAFKPHGNRVRVVAKKIVEKSF